MSDSPEQFKEPANLRFLRRLVTVLTGTMIVGLVAIFGLLVMRFSAEVATAPLPSNIILPDGKTAAAFTQGPDWYAVVTTGDEILIYNRSDNTLRQTVQISP